MKMKYKAGDVVLVRSDLIEYIQYYKMNSDKADRGAIVTSDMKALCGQCVTIRVADKVINRYRVREDVNNWAWTDQMFEGLVDEFDDVDKYI